MGGSDGKGVAALEAADTKVASAQCGAASFHFACKLIDELNGSSEERCHTATLSI